MDSSAESRAGTARGSSESVELSKLQASMARRVAEAKATIPHLLTEAEIELADPFAAPGSHTELAAAIVGGCAAALRELPRFNGSYRDGKLELHSRVNVAFAVAAQQSTLTPTVFDADGKQTAALAEQMRELTESAQAGTITSRELSGATFTVNLLLDSALTRVDPVIVPGQAAALAAGGVFEKPVARGGELVTVPALRLALACDARILEPVEAARFLASLQRALGPGGRQR